MGFFKGVYKEYDKGYYGGFWVLGFRVSGFRLLGFRGFEGLVNAGIKGCRVLGM